MGKHMPAEAIHVENNAVNGGFSYPIYIESGLLKNNALFDSVLAAASSVIILSDENVMKAYGDTIKQAIDHAERTLLTTCILPAGEHSKSLIHLEQTLSQCLDAGIDRDTMIIALGGGVVGDHAGFAAAILMRGLRIVQIPTSLLAMVDSSVGGKTGINMPQGKNLVGAFHHPEAVIIDADVLKSLPEREFWAGYAEVVKTALINNVEFFHYLKGHIQDVKSRESHVLSHIIKTCCAAKAQIVAKDAREKGVRALLNLGHTFGHALEAENQYGPLLLHGEAVAIGCTLAYEFSAQLGLGAKSDFEQVKSHFEDVGLPTKIQDIPSLSSLTTNKMLAHMMKDKKNKHGQLRLILAKTIGECFIAKDVDLEVLKQFLNHKLKH